MSIASVGSPFKSLSLLTISIGTKAAASIVVFLVAAKIFGSEEFGKFIYDFSLASLLCLACDYGFPSQILKNGTSQRTTLPPLLATKIWLTLSISFAGLMLCIMGAVESQQNFILILAAVIICSYFDLYCTYLRAKDHTKLDFYLSTTTNIATIAALVWVLLEWQDVNAFCIAMLAARSLQLVAALLITKDFKDKCLSVLPFLYPNRVKDTIRSGFYFAADTAVNAALNYIDAIFLNHTAGATITGQYQAAARFNQGIPLLYSVLVSYYLPRLSEKNTAEKHKLLKKSFLALSIATWLALALSFIMIGWIYQSQPEGSVFYEAAPYFYGLIAIAFLRILSGWLSTLLTASGLQKQKTIAYALCLLVIIFSTHHLIIMFGAWGVVISNVIGYTVCMVVLGITIKLRKPSKVQSI